METRGRDAVGLAFRHGGMNTCYKQSIPATDFVDDNENIPILSDARRSLRGIAHTRRASPGMPINDVNSHPFAFWRYFFAHNGKIQNWEEIRDVLKAHFKQEVERLKSSGDAEKLKTVEYCADYCNRITTDSMVLGPYIESRDFSQLIGCMGLVWMQANNVYTLRYAKEAVATTIVWRYTKLPQGETNEDQIVTIVSSTPQIIMSAIKKVPDIEFDATDPEEFAEGRIFRVDPTGLVDEGSVPTNRPVVDVYSSEVVEETPKDEPKVEEPAKVEPPTKDPVYGVDYV
jgi:predicted glutamine amidotransferase